MYIRKENIIEINGKKIYDAFEEYEPNLIFILNDYAVQYNEIKFEDIDLQKVNLTNEFGSIYYVEGFYYKKNGNRIFDLNKKGHWLIEISWGGSFNKTRGFKNPITGLCLTKEEKAKLGIIRYVRESSNGGGLGSDYLIVPEGWYCDWGKIIDLGI